ncbi:response regulator transcription factor [Halioglobus pacificus]|uniref:HTH luxR-type domain-containing protein n=1 Tax=Parahalioglobus pacificus TaxID=930806 RepID=A0A918XCT6_9GAMM|nr:response regulator transcription factor [Halioglobus pacificus]NQY02292.1 response regulator transcription factor [Halieaceae bacterium]GHD25158.1 hypothetical protein GCM10007053_00580 [Halioglobus pacificus]
MEHIFVTVSARLRDRWTRAFPQALAVADTAAIPHASESPSGVVWLDTSSMGGDEVMNSLTEAVAFGWPVVAMTPTPEEAQAFKMLNAGAVGYCHVKAVPEQLREIGIVVQHGGVWMPPDLMQRFIKLSTRIAPPPPVNTRELNELTSRELMVAEQVAHGASNREIATNLEISERTVKAHLSVIFDKMGVRDRVQLALAMNSVPIYTSVN